MKRSVTLGLLLTLALACAASAEIAPKSKARLRDKSTHIVTGTVKAIYANTTSEAPFRKTPGVVEVRVSKLEKGTGIT